VGINRPEPAGPPDAVYTVVTLQEKALATSGDYRNFFELDGVRYSHVIDPRSGFPVSNGVVSVSIIADTCTLADGLATAIMVMGAEKGIRLADRLPNVEAFIVVENANGNLQNFSSQGFKSDKRFE
jgi:thiamine biosynthesis lipoprotein